MIDNAAEMNPKIEKVQPPPRAITTAKEQPLAQLVKADEDIRFSRLTLNDHHWD